MPTSNRAPSFFFLVLGTAVVFALYGGWCVGVHVPRVGCPFIVLAFIGSILSALRWGRERAFAVRASGSDADTDEVHIDLPLANEISVEIPPTFEVDGTTREIHMPAAEATMLVQLEQVIESLELGQLELAAQTRPSRRTA